MAINWTNIYKKHQGDWVALKEDEKTVISSGRTARLALERAQKKGCEKPILTRMPKELTTYVGFGL